VSGTASEPWGSVLGGGAVALLGGIDRLIDYYADDVHPPEYLATLQKLWSSPVM